MPEPRRMDVADAGRVMTPPAAPRRCSQHHGGRHPARNHGDGARPRSHSRAANSRAADSRAANSRAANTRTASSAPPSPGPPDPARQILPRRLPPWLAFPTRFRHPSAGVAATPAGDATPAESRRRPRHLTPPPPTHDQGRDIRAKEVAPATSGGVPRASTQSRTPPTSQQLVRCSKTTAGGRRRWRGQSRDGRAHHRRRGLCQRGESAVGSSGTRFTRRT